MTGPILKLTNATNSHPVYVNFALVQSFGPDPAGGTWIFQVPALNVFVREPLKQIVARLGDTDAVWVGEE